MSETSALIQTVAILAACVVFLAKEGYRVYDRKKNGTGGDLSGSKMIKLSELHDWHKPVTDPETGQPRFMWYADSKDLREQLEKNRESMDELRSAIGRMNDSLMSLVAEIRNQQQSKQEEG